MFIPSGDGLLRGDAGSDVVFDFGNGDTLTIKNTTLADVQDDLIIA